MSLYGMMRTGVSGMNAQASRLSTVADNIANSGTTGYKRSRTEFSTMVLPSTGGSYASGGVTANVQTAISAQGVLQYTTSATDLAISGDGFFVVRDSSGSTYMTRAGSFVVDGSGNLVNAAGYQLMGYSYANGTPTATANGYEGLEAINIAQTSLEATPSTTGIYTANLPSTADVGHTAKTSLVTYDNLGERQMIDVQFTKTADNTWQVEAYDDAGGLLVSQTLTFDPTSGQLASGGTLSFTVPDGQPLTLDLSSMSQLANDFETYDARVDGNAPSAIEAVEISSDGTVYAQYGDGSFRPLYRIALATVQSPDMLTALPGNVFAESADSGRVQIRFPEDGGMGKVVSGALESSNVDIAQELTSMIESQRTYTANSKVFQTGSELMDILVNLKR